MKDVRDPVITGRLTMLSDKGKQDIYDAAVRIATEIGMRVPHPVSRDLLVAAGATVDDGDLVHVSREMIENARKTAPASFTVYDRDGELAMEVGNYHSYFGTGSDLMTIYDLETGDVRPSGLADVARAAHVCDALPNIDFIMSCAYPHDVEPASRAYLESFRAMVSNTTKPMVMTAEGADDLEVMWKIASELRGSAEELRAKPYFIMYGEPVSPLRHASEVLDKLLFCADWGIPAIYSPAPSAGATAPITQAGHIVLAVAESLFGLVIHQLRKPGAPFVFGMGPVKIDMSTVQALYNSAEYYTTILGICEMAKWLDLPNWGYAGSSDSHLVDAQAGMDAAELTLLSMQAGSNLNHDIGYLAFGLVGALELVVITDEIISLNRRTLEGIEVSDETLGVEVIAKVGPGGDFLREKHTARYVRGQQWMPTMLNRKTRDHWKADGSPDLRERARRKALAILADHKPAPIAPAVKATIDRLTDGYRPAQ
jgi:trimethylamine--corrinoid protein Co-methyltransferase